MSDRRLIEEFLPVRAISSLASSEKIGGRKGHISTLHLWWARRPLAAARAAVYAALVPAPKELEAEKLGDRFTELCTWGGADVAVPVSAIDEARKAIRAGNGGAPRRVLDVFAGGGAIPLEATRLGCQTTAVELNPVAHIIELASLDYPQRYGRPLARDVETWGRWVLDRARERLAAIYPSLPDKASTAAQPFQGGGQFSGRVPIAYLWTRTVACPNLAQGPHFAPLVRQTWLSKNPDRHRFIALRIAPDRSSMTNAYEVVEAVSESGLGFDPAGLSKRGSTTCPLCGASVDLKYVKSEAKAGRLGTELMAAALVTPGQRGKTYLGSADAARLKADPVALATIRQGAERAGVTPPDSRICDTDTLNFKVPLYGLTRFQDLYVPRQLAMLMTLCWIAREAYDEMIKAGMDAGRAKAVATYLGMLVDRVADRSSTICRWDSSPSSEKTTNTYARQALPMTWDFSECNPFGGASGDIGGQLEYIVSVVEHCSQAGEPVRVIRGSATELPFEDGEFDAVITDPPYYDNISYADLSDFFYVWLQRSVGHLYPEHFSAPLTPKRSEVIAATYRHADRDTAREAYEAMMRRSFDEARRVLKPSGILVCVYAHQTTAGWSTLIEAVRKAGFVVVEAWPLDTEMSTRGAAQGSASLASSIFLVARRRDTLVVGDWANDVRPELHEIVTARISDLPELGVTGADLVIAAVGAGMRAYTRYDRVEKPNGDELGPEEYLEEVEREVSEAVLARIFQVDRGGLGRVDQLTQFYVMGRFEFAEAVAPWDELNTLARGTGVELVTLTRPPHPIVGFGKKRSEVRILDYSTRGRDDRLGLDGSRSTIDHLHRVLWLAENHPQGVKDYLAVGRPDSGRLRLVAQALAQPGLQSAARTKEQEACERLLPTWKRLVEDNLFGGEAG